MPKTTPTTTPAPSAVGDSNPTNGACLLCGTSTGGTGLLCGRCVALPVPRR